MIKAVTYLKFIGMGVSISFTILMLQLMAGGLHEHILYFLAGMIPELSKIILLLAALKHKRIGFYFLLLPFLLVSLAASILFTVHTLNARVHEFSRIDDTDIRHQLAVVEAERADELNRVNALLDSLPQHYVNRRAATLQDRAAMLEEFDSTIADLRSQLIDVENDTQSNLLTDSINRIAELFNMELDTAIFIIAVILGTILDLGGVSLALVEGYERDRETARENQERIERDRERQARETERIQRDIEQRERDKRETERESERIKEKPRETERIQREQETGLRAGLTGFLEKSGENKSGNPRETERNREKPRESTENHMRKLSETETEIEPKSIEQSHRENPRESTENKREPELRLRETERELRETERDTRETERDTRDNYDLLVQLIDTSGVVPSHEDLEYAGIKIGKSTYYRYMKKYRKDLEKLGED